MGKGRAEGKEGNDTKAPPEGGVQYQFAIKPVEKPGWEGFKDFIWNTETSEFLGRTASSWLKITVFYIVYYLLLTGFFIVMLLIFFQTLHNDEPKWKNDNGIIGGNPGMGYRPNQSDAHVESTLITFKHAKDRSMGTWGGWVDRLDKFLEVYDDDEKPDDGKDKRSVDDTKQIQAVQCDFKIAPNGPPEGQMCKVSSKDFLRDPCTKESNYGFANGSPCILLKLNKIFDWLPKPYNSTTLPDNAPLKLKEFVTKWDSENKDNVGKMVWLSCEGENPADVENVGDINYFPYPGIPNYHFPYTNQKDYRSPVVFAHLVAPKQGVLIAIECKAWAHNIKHDETKMERIGSVHFELLID